MSNEGEMLEIVNDLRDQYIELKDKLNKEIAFKDEYITQLEHDLRIRHMLFKDDQFSSCRPLATIPKYTSNRALDFYHCVLCGRSHPKQSTCA